MFSPVEKSDGRFVFRTFPGYYNKKRFLNYETITSQEAYGMFSLEIEVAEVSG